MEVYKLGNAGMAPGYPKKSYDVFPKAPQNASAAFHALNHVYIIKGKVEINMFVCYIIF